MPRVSSVPVRPHSAQTAARMTPESGPVRLGKIAVAPHAIATIAGRAVAQCYGVVGIAAPRARFGRVELLAPEQYSHGVVVRFADDHITIDVHVVLEYGLRITEIAHNIMESVKFAVERPLGLRVVRVNVHVLALRVDGGE
jgi:uncharacterized alkaline shock family protein YloU